MGLIPYKITRTDDDQVMATGNFDDTLLDGSTIPVDLIRSDNNDVISQINIDPTKVYPVYVAPPQQNSLNLLAANTDFLTRASDLVLSGQFSMEVTCQGLVQNGTYCPLFANASTGNRVLLSGISGLVGLNIGGSGLVTKPITVDVGLEHTYKLYRNATNEIYFQVDNEAPIYMSTNTNNFSLRYIGKASSSFKITGVINRFKINNDEFLLQEGSGTTLTSSNGLQTWTISSAGGTSYINENVWFVAPDPVASVQVVNKGVGGNNAYDMDLRFNADVNPYAPDAVIITPGTNDAINSTNHLTPAQYKTYLLSMVNKAIALGATPYIWNIPPVIDSYKKADHDYTTIYGDESTFDLNLDILPQYRAKVSEVAAETGAIVLDILSVFTANGDPAITMTSYLRNEINVGDTDGVHFTPSGRQALANYIAPFLVGKTKIVWIGDSNVATGGATSMCILVSQILNS